MPPPIVIVGYDPAWPKLFEREQSCLRRTLGDRLIAIEHIGSTAVPGLGAKPIVDIMAGIASLDEAVHCTKPLQALGYLFRPEVMAWLPDGRLFVKWSMGSEAAHLHLAEYGGSFWREKLLFRDSLRTRPDLAQRYEALKRTLAPRFSEGPSYSAAKTAFIQAALARARQIEAETALPEPSQNPLNAQ